MIYTKHTYQINSKKPHFFIGSKIRGALGYALKEEVCVNPTFECESCFALKECAFYNMYEQQNSTHEYRLDFKLYNDKYKFSLLLFNDLIKHEQAINKAVLNSLKEYKKIKNTSKSKILKQKKHHSTIKIEFLTPLRIKKENHFATKDIELFDILHSIHKRNLAIKKESYKRLDIGQDYKIVSKNLRYQELTRKSNKQNTKMNMGGLMGEIVIGGVSKDIYNLLKLGEIIGVGKNTAFGLGKLRVEDIG